MGILTRAKNLAKALSESSLEKSETDVAPRGPALSLKTSPLTRTMAWHVGRGASAGMLQEVASAALAEAGEPNVSKSSWVNMHRIFFRDPLSIDLSVWLSIIIYLLCKVGAI